jgi:hypothetical protein
MKVALLVGGEKTVREALRQALELQAVFLAARSHTTSTKTFWGSRSPSPDKRTQGIRNAGAVENRATSRVPATTEQRQKITGAGNLMIGQAETRGNGQESLSGEQVTTKEQTGGVADRRETSKGRRMD